MTTNHTIPAPATGEERSGYEGRLLGGTRSLPPRLVPVPPPPEQAREAATVADNQRRTTHSFAWHLVDAFRDGFELRMDAAGHPLARLTVGGMGTPSARLDAGGQRLLFTEVANRQVTIADADTRTVVAEFEWQRPGRRGTLRFVEGGQLWWRRTSRWRRTFTVVDRFGNPLLRLSPDGRALGRGLDTPPEPSAGSRDDLTMLLALGWFLLISSGAATRPEPVATP
jgi:hypothetical protein